MIQSVKIILLCVIAAVTYGILHDQITARICLEYFTVGHPKVMDSTDPTLLAFAWGILATWWVGVLLGVPLAFFARIGRHNRRTARELIRPIIRLLIVMAVCAGLSGLSTWIVIRNADFYLAGPIAQDISIDKHVGFFVDLVMHNVSYFVGFLGGIVTIAHVWYQRHQSPRMSKVK